MTWFRLALAVLGFLYVLSRSPLTVTADMPVHGLSVLALAPLEDRAVVKAPDGGLHVIRRGDPLPGTTATVLQVLPDKLVVEERTDTAPANGKRLVWIYKTPPEGGDSRVQRLQRQPPAAPSTLINTPHHRQPR